ncbi:MAG: hypothetical protein DIU71_05880 [Proteobacteria bacterium]|nr:MAG: hypothetical protein DIU71_05880 [Pseudomonadota bacterium]
MFETLPQLSFDTLLIAARAVMLIGAFWVFALAFTRWRREDERNTRALHQQLERAFGELRSMHETVAVMSARLEALSEHAQSEAHRAPAAVTAAQRGYDVAARMAKHGADVQTLVETCGVTRHEAELLVRLHGAPGVEPAGTPPPARKRGSLLSVVG